MLINEADIARFYRQGCNFLIEYFSVVINTFNFADYKVVYQADNYRVTINI